MRIVDLFSGLEGWGGPHREHHRVCSVDLDPRFGADITADVLEPDLADRIRTVLDGDPDLLLGSPPCEAFSVLGIGRNWTGPKDVPAHAPKTDAARLALRLVERTLDLIAELGPTFFVIENPRAKLRALPVLGDLERRTVTYCRLGLPFMKPTDLWGGFPASLGLPAPCDTRGGDIVSVDGIPYVVDRQTGRPCHVSAPRGSTTGIQGDGVITSRIESRPTRGGLSAQKDMTRRVYGTSDAKDLAALRAEVPERLSRLVVEAAEVDLAAGSEPVRATLF